MISLRNSNPTPPITGMLQAFLIEIIPQDSFHPLGHGNNSSKDFAHKFIDGPSPAQQPKAPSVARGGATHREWR